MWHYYDIPEVCFGYREPLSMQTWKAFGVFFFSLAAREEETWNNCFKNVAFFPGHDWGKKLDLRWWMLLDEQNDGKDGTWARSVRSERVCKSNQGGPTVWINTQPEWLLWMVMCSVQILSHFGWEFLVLFDSGLKMLIVFFLPWSISVRCLQHIFDFWLSSVNACFLQRRHALASLDMILSNQRFVSVVCFSGGSHEKHQQYSSAIPLHAARPLPQLYQVKQCTNILWRLTAVLRNTLTLNVFGSRVHLFFCFLSLQGSG